MILKALNSLYERLAADPDSGVALYGYSRQQISFIVVLDRKGALHEIQDARRADDKGRLRPRAVVVPGNAKPSGSGINPCFLWDNAAYSLGYKQDDPKPERTREAFEAFRARHLAAESEIDDPEFAAVCRFLESWEPACAVEQPVLAELAAGFGVFQIRNATHFVHERPAVKAWWEASLRSAAAAGEAAVGQCLVTGEIGPIARLHEPKIKGVWGGQSAGAVLVSFNFPSGESYGKSGDRAGMNAQTSEQAAFQYCTALNWLLDPPAKRRLSIGDTTVAYWTDGPSPAEDWIAELLNPSLSAEDEAQRNRLGDVLNSIAKGEFPEELGEQTTRFYILGLAPNAARISVRSWHESTLGNLIQNLRQHFEDLELLPIENGSYSFPSIRRLIGETVPANKKKYPDEDRLAPLLAGETLRSVLTGRNYPESLSQLVHNRVRLDGLIDPDSRLDWRAARHRRVSIIKACLNRKLRHSSPTLQEMIVDPALDKLHTSAAYQCGRLMAVLSFAQELALKQVNSTVVRRFLSAASTSPALYLGRLEIAAEVGHLPKLRKQTATFLRDELKAINGRLSPDEIPPVLKPLERSLFVIGFYHELAYVERGRATLKHLHRTMRGEWVRSAGEKRLADAMYKLGVPYVYEAKMILKTGGERFPDFMVPATREQDNVYVEWLGVDGPDAEQYEKQWNDKQLAYANEGITPSGGPRGTLRWIDARKSTQSWDEPRISTQLSEWFGHRA